MEIHCISDIPFRKKTTARHAVIPVTVERTRLTVPGSATS